MDVKFHNEKFETDFNEKWNVGYTSYVLIYRWIYKKLFIRRKNSFKLSLYNSIRCHKRS